MNVQQHPSQHDAGPDAPDGDGPPAGRAFLGTVALFLGAALLCLLMVDRTTGLAFVPRSWSSDRALWSFFAIASIVAGCLLLRSARPSAHSRENDAPAHVPGWRPTRGGVRFRAMTLYTRAGCHLCDQAREMLLAHSRYLPPLQELDIDADPRLAEQFGTCVPVVEIDGRVRFRGRVNEVLLRRLIEGTRPEHPMRQDA